MKYEGFKTRAWIYVVLLLVALDWISIHNIIQGKHNLTGEYITVVSTIIVFIILVVLLKKQNNTQKHDESNQDE